MEDAAGSEQLSLKAQRDYQANVGNNANTVIAGDETHTVTGNQQITIGGNHQASIGGRGASASAGRSSSTAPDTTFTGKKLDATVLDITVDSETI